MHQLLHTMHQLLHTMHQLLHSMHQLLHTMHQLLHTMRQRHAESVYPLDLERSRIRSSPALLMMPEFQRNQFRLFQRHNASYSFLL